MIAMASSIDGALIERSPQNASGFESAGLVVWHLNEMSVLLTTQYELKEHAGHKGLRLPAVLSDIYFLIVLDVVYILVWLKVGF